MALPYDHENALRILSDQRTFFSSGATRSHAFRKNVLKALLSSIKTHEAEVIAALHADMRKPSFEAFISEIGTVYQELRHALLHLKEWMREEHVTTPLSLQIASSVIKKEPLGVVLIIAPWNYPFQLIMDPLIAAVAAGNCVLLKPSEEVPNTAAIIEKIIAEVFRPEHIAVVQGEGSVVVPQLIEAFRFDHIFFTGSPGVGRKILAMAAQELVPVTLELGGKSPAIIDRKVDIKTAIKRIAWGKFFNAGQTCIAPDHVLVHESRRDEFLDGMKRTIAHFYGEDPRESPYYARIINDKQFDRLIGYLDQGSVLVGGSYDRIDRYIAPTVMTGISHERPIMQQEIFGPILPVISWQEKEEVIEFVARNPCPLSTYVFSDDKKNQRYFSERIAFGGGCINHCLLHFGNASLPFGGVGTSGMGRYHGKFGFDLFSHSKPIVDASTLIDHGLQYPPYTERKQKIARTSMT